MYFIKNVVFSKSFTLSSHTFLPLPLTFYHSTTCGTFYHSTNHVVHNKNYYDERHGEETVTLKFFNWEHSWINTICVECIYRTLRSNIELIFISDSLNQFQAFSEKKATSKYYSKIAFKISFQIGGRRSYFVCVGAYMVSTV